MSPPSCGNASASFPATRERTRSPMNPSFPVPFDRRIVAIDLVRGLVMILMALDHTRDYFSRVDFDPLDLNHSTPDLFLTRWITHFCAPLFIYLSGVSAYLSLHRTGDAPGQARLLWQRGLLLIVLELTWVHWLGWAFSLDVRRTVGGVLWAIGWSMIMLSPLIRLRPASLLIAGSLMIVTHNLLDGITPETFGPLAWLWRILHAGGSFDILFGARFVALYPLIPWVGLMMAGFGCGPLFLRDAPGRRQWLIRWGWGLALAFVWLRAGNLYGDPSPWEAHESDLATLLSFLNCTKYPPSLLYLLMTLGPGLLLLAALDRPPPRWLQPVNVFGQVPLFFYLLHLPLIHGLAALIDLGRYGRANWQFGWPFVAERLPKPPDHGFGLLIVYLVTAVIILSLYPLCRWYAGLKRTQTSLWARWL
ncbi:MAG: DUF1624 domain-containing protein [Methylococcus sp.]